MYNIYIWSDNQKIVEALEFMFDVGRSTVRKMLPSYQPSMVESFRLFTATDAYLREEALPPFEMRVAMRQDLQPSMLDYERLARFTAKNMIGEEQVVSTVLDGEDLTQVAKQYSSVMSKKTASTFKNVMPGNRAKLYKMVKNPSSITVGADDLKHFIGTVKKKIFPKVDGELLYIDGAYEGGAGENRGITVMGVTFKGHVDGRVSETTNTGTLIYDTIIQSEIIVVAFFDGRYKAGKSSLTLPKDANWYKLITGGKTGGASLCKMGSVLRVTTTKGISILSDDPSRIEIATTPAHDQSSILQKPIAEYDEDYSDGPDDIEVDMRCEADLFSSVLTTISGKKARIGFPRNGDGLVLFADDHTGACVVAKSALKKEPPKPVEEVKEEPEAKQVEVSTHPDEIGLKEVTEYEDLGDDYALKVNGVMVAAVAKAMVKRMSEAMMADSETLVGQVLNAVTRANGRSIDRAEIMEYIPGANLDSIGAALSSLYRRGKIERPGKGMYRIPT